MSILSGQKKKKTIWTYVCMKQFNIYHSLSKFSRRQIGDIFPRKQDSTFDANCLKCRKFADNLHKMLNPVFWEK